MEALKRIKVLLFLLASLIVCGSSGYRLIEGWGWLDSFYMTIITISTVGFGEVDSLSSPGKIFTIFLILSSVGVFAYTLGVVVNFILEGTFGYLSRRIRMEREREKIKDHYIICGLGKVAQEVIREFLKNRVKFLVVAEEAEIKGYLGQENILYLEADPTKDEVLEKAKIRQARGLISCLSTDKENLFTVISARSFNPALKIITLAQDEASLAKMIKAGADKVILPDIIGGRRMAYMVLKPDILSFLDVVTNRSNEDFSLRLELIEVSSDSSIRGQTLLQAQLPQKTGVLVVAIKKASEGGEFIYNPSSSYKIEAKDKLIILGREEEIQTLKEYIA